MSDATDQENSPENGSKKLSKSTASRLALDDGQLGQIQSLLFGSQLERLLARIEDLESRLVSFESRHESELAKVDSQARDTVDHFNLEVDSLRTTLSSSQDEARADLMALIDELRQKKLDRAALAGLLGNVAEQIDDHG